MRQNKVAESLTRASRDMERQIVREALKEVDRGLSIRDLIEEFDGAGFGEGLRSLTLADIAEAVGGDALVRARHADSSRSAALGSSNGNGARVTRTAEGREAMDHEVSRFVRSVGTTSAENVRSSIGGSAHQVRQSLSRLIETGTIKKTGERRATRYHWAE